MKNAAASTLLALAISAAAPALAQAPASGADDVTTRMTPYFWVAGLHGKVATSSLLPTTKVDASFADIMDHFNFGLMAAGEIRKDRAALIFDLMFMSLGADQRRGPVKAELDLRSWTVTAAVAYRIYGEAVGPTVDLYGGGRFWSQTQELDARPIVRAEVSKSWIDALIGGTVRVPVAEHVAVRGTFDVGAGGSDISWHGLATIQYQTGRFTLEAGYRHLYDDYRSGSFLYKAHMYGPILGASYRF